MGERIVRFEKDQQLSEPDLNNIGLYGRSSLDNVVLDAIQPGRKFVGFNVVASGPAQVTVGEGRLYSLGKVFRRSDQGGTDIDLISLLPVTVQKIVTIAVWGQEVESGLEPRSFLVDVDTEQTEARTTPTEIRRVANLNTVSGLESADPQPAPLDANVIAVAHVLLSPEGIVEIRMVNENRMPSVADNRQRIDNLELFRDRAGAAIETLRTDLVGVASKQRGLAGRGDLVEVAADVARLKEVVGLPVDYASYGATDYLDPNEGHQEHPDWLAKIEEGVRFPAAQVSVAQLMLLNQFDDKVTVSSNFMLPKYQQVDRVVVDGPQGEISISQYVFNTWVTRQRTMSRERIRYGSTIRICTNAAAWRHGYVDPVSGLFRRGNETFQIVQQESWKVFRLRQIWVDTYEESYWEAIEVEESVQGAGVAQTFLNSQDGWMTRISLKFSRVAATGDVKVLICETVNGAPAWDRVIAKTTVDTADLRLSPNWTDIPIGPVHLKAGRYAVVVITPGNHFLATVSNNKYAEGTLFVSTDGAFSQGDLTRDLVMKLSFAQFASPRIEVQMQPITLENGIANLDFLVEGVRPPGAEITHEVQINSIWRPLDENTVGALNGLPALLPYRIVFNGTTDVHAGLKLGAASTVTAWRPRTDFKFVSDEINLPTACDEIELRMTVEWWEDARHDLEIRLLTGASFDTVVSPSVVEVRDLPDSWGVEDRKEIRAVFSGLLPAIEAFKYRLAGTTDNALVTYHVARRVFVAFAS